MKLKVQSERRSQSLTYLNRSKPFLARGARACLQHMAYYTTCIKKLEFYVVCIL